MATQSATKQMSNVRSGMVVANRRRGQIIRLVIVILGCIFALYPFVMIVGTSLDPRNTIANAQIIPSVISLENYNKLFSGTRTPIFLWIKNSIIVSSISTVAILFLTTLAAYSLSRFRFTGRRTTLLATLVIQVFPTVVALTAFYLLLNELGKIIPWLGLDTLGGLILIYCGGALGANAFLMKGYFDTIPREIDESAMVDGASHWTTFTQIILPLVRPILAVIGLLTFIGTFNDYLIPRALLRNSENFTFAVGMTIFLDNQFAVNWGIFAAGALIGAVPVIILFLVLQTQIVSGLSQGAVKG